MISAKKLIKMLRKWQKLAALNQKRILLPRSSRGVHSDSCSTSSVADKGHFVVYTVDKKRFVMPLVYLNNNIVKELFKLAEEEFGLPSSGLLTLPCDAVFLQYVVTLIQLHLSEDVEKALLESVVTGCCSSSSSLHQELTNPQRLICSF